MHKTDIQTIISITSPYWLCRSQTQLLENIMPCLFLRLAACLWGGNYVVGHFLVTQADPIILSEARWLLTAVLLMSLYFRQVKQQWP